MTSTPISVSPLRNTPTITAPMSVPMMASAPAEQARATEDDCGDAVEVLGGLARVRIAELGTGDEEQRRDPRGEPGQRVDAEQDAVRVDAGQARGLRVVADGVDMNPQAVCVSENQAIAYSTSMKTTP